MEKKICVRCDKESKNGLPLCDDCREVLKDFDMLVEYLNGFKGSKEDLLYILASEINSRQSSIINSCQVVPNYAEGIIELIPKEPSNTTVQQKPWLWDRYLSIKRVNDEIKKLRRAQLLAIQFYGGDQEG